MISGGATAEEAAEEFKTSKERILQKAAELGVHIPFIQRPSAEAPTLQNPARVKISGGVRFSGHSTAKG
jgi:hypothetical protein